MLLSWLKTLFNSIFKVFKANNTQVEEKTFSPKTSLSSREIDEALSQIATDLSIPFYPKLIDHLEMDHKHLINLYTNIGYTLSFKEYQLLPGQLSKFKEDLAAHLEAENIKFYGYLEQSLKNQTEQFASLRRFRKEMRTIERTVLKFLDQWIEDGVNASSADEFKAQYDAIGAALVKRIESEEAELYTMYVHA